MTSNISNQVAMAEGSIYEGMNVLKTDVITSFAFRFRSNDYIVVDAKLDQNEQAATIKEMAQKMRDFDKANDS